MALRTLGEDLEDQHRAIAADLSRHLGGCEEQNKALTRELGLLRSDVGALFSRFWKVALLVITAQASLLGIVVTAYLTFGHR